MKFSIIIPNWNRKQLLEKNLPAVLVAKPDEIIVVDNASEDGSVTFLEQKYPEVHLIKNSTNLGFAVGCNQGVKQSLGELVVLLNNDVVPEKNFIVKTASLFKDPKLFAVSFHEPQWSWARIFWSKGFIEHEPGPKDTKTHLSAWASGGSSIFRKSIWEKLGGFDDLYNPFYWEDIDLSYRAWKRGYQVLWEPQSIVHHHHEGTIGSHFSKNYIDFISQRNQLLFTWKNITDSKMLTNHKLGLAKRLFFHPGYLLPFLAALKRLSAVYQARKKESKLEIISDRIIFEKFT